MQTSDPSITRARAPTRAFSTPPTKPNERGLDSRARMVTGGTVSCLESQRERTTQAASRPNDLQVFPLIPLPGQERPATPPRTWAGERRASPLEASDPSIHRPTGLTPASSTPPISPSERTPKPLVRVASRPESQGARTTKAVGRLSCPQVPYSTPSFQLERPARPPRIWLGESSARPAEEFNHSHSSLSKVRRPQRPPRLAPQRRPLPPLPSSQTNEAACLDPDKEGNTDLHEAARTGAHDIFFSLLEVLKLADKNREGKTALHVAIDARQIDLIQAVIERGFVSSEQPLYEYEGAALNLLAYAISRGEFQCAELLLASGFDLKQWTTGLGNLFHVAAYFNRVDALEYLLLQKADQTRTLVDQQNDQGQTPLSVAASSGASEAVLLLYNKASRTLHIPDHEDLKPIHHACRAGHRTTVQLLVELGCEAAAFRGARRMFGRGDDDRSRSFANLLDNLALQVDHPQRSSRPTTQSTAFLCARGGGAKGPALAGALVEMERMGILQGIRGVAGTSVGAIIMGLIAVGYSAQQVSEIICSIDFIDFLDHPFRQSSDIRSKKKCAASLSKLLSSAKNLILKPLGSIVTTGQQLSQMLHSTGICEGEVFRNWLEGLISAKTGIAHLTFGELKNLPGGRDLIVYNTVLEGGRPSLMGRNTRDLEWKDDIISDAIRSSMSYPGVFKPHQRYVKVDGERLLFPGASHIDGGLLANLPMFAFDELRYQKPIDGPEGRRHIFNDETVGLSLFSSRIVDKGKGNVNNIVSLLMGIIQTYMNAEEIVLSHQPEQARRIIQIDVEEAGTLSFGMSSDMKQKLLNNGMRDARVFFEARQAPLSSLQRSLALGRAVTRRLDHPIHSVPATHPHFVDREEGMGQLQEALIGPLEKWTSSLPIKPVLLYGPEGFGKSQLAFAFANNHLNDFSMVWTIDCTDPELYSQSYRELAERLHLSLPEGESIESIEMRVHSALEQLEQPWMLIIDQVMSADQLPSTPQKGGAILITCRESTSDPRIRSIRLGGFDLNEVQELMNKVLKINNRIQALDMMQQCHNDPSLIEQTIRRRALSKTNSASTVTKATGMRLLEPNSPTLAFLEMASHLHTVPYSFFQDWLDYNIPGQDPKGLIQTLEQWIRPLGNAQEIQLRGTAREQSKQLQAEQGRLQACFGTAFHAYQDWLVRQPEEGWRSSPANIRFAEQEQGAMWAEVHHGIRCNLYLRAGLWTANIGSDFEQSKDYIVKAQSLCPSDNQVLMRDISRAEQELTVLKHHPKALAFLKLAAHLPKFPPAFFQESLALSPEEMQQVVDGLVADGVLQKGRSFLRVKTEPAKFLLAEESFRQRQFNEALGAFNAWLKLPTTTLEKAGECCYEALSALTEVAMNPSVRSEKSYWDQAPSASKEEIYSKASQYCRREGIHHKAR